jgi:hypothetical protein
MEKINASEAAQARRIALRTAGKLDHFGGCGFRHLQRGPCTRSAAGHDILFRLSRSRFKALVRDAERIDEGPNHKSFQLRLEPKRQGSKNKPRPAEGCGRRSRAA